MKKAILFFDGGSRGNPGAAAGGCVLKINGQTITDSKYLPYATNNEAEYIGLIVGLKLAIEEGVQELTIYGDSKLVVNQVNMIWKASHPQMLSLCQQAQKLLRNFEYYALFWIPREKNSEADAIVNLAIDEATNCTKDYFVESQKLKRQINSLITKGHRATEKDYLALKSGNDGYSRKNLASLLVTSGLDIANIVRESYPDIEDTNLAKVLRWYLRGLPIQMAIKKVQVDIQASDHVAAAMQRKHYEAQADADVVFDLVDDYLYI